MIMTRRIVTASVIAFTLLTCPQTQAKEETTVRDFLKWERSKQDSFLTVSIMMAGVIATQIRPGFADCIGKWYSLDREKNLERHTEVLEVMNNFQDFIPGGIVVAVLQKECGKFGGL